MLHFWSHQQFNRFNRLPGIHTRKWIQSVLAINKNFFMDLNYMIMKALSCWDNFLNTEYVMFNLSKSISPSRNKHLSLSFFSNCLCAVECRSCSSKAIQKEQQVSLFGLKVLSDGIYLTINTALWRVGSHSRKNVKVSEACDLREERNYGMCY